MENTLCRSLALGLLLGCAALSFPARAGGGSDWVQPGTGAWTEPTNWSPERVPDANFGDEPTIDNGGTAQLASGAPPDFGLLTIGQSNAGALEVTGGALESDSFAILGESAGSTGTLTVSGAGSSLTLFREMRIGRLGSATVLIDAGGALTSNTSGSTVDTIIAENSGSVSSVTVRGAGSSWQANDDLRIAMPATGAFGASGGTATLTIANGGVVSSEGGTLARGDVADATVTVAGAGSTWNANGFNIAVGSGTSDNQALLVVEAGGRIAARDININPPDTQPGNRTLRVGSGGSPGVLDIRRVFGAGSGGGLLEIDHDQPDYHLTTDGTATGTPVTLEAGLVMRHSGPGTTVLSGANETNGTFNIDAGTVVVEGSFFAGSYIFDPVFNVNAGGTLAGSGSARGNVTVADGGTIAPGASVGTLITKSLTLDPGSVLDYELAAAGTVGGGVNDLIDSDGNVVLDGTLNITDVGGFGPGTYRLIDYQGSLTDNGLSIGSAPAGFGYQIDTGTANQVDLVVGTDTASALVLPGQLSFANVESGQSSTPEPVVVFSDGKLPLDVGSVSISGFGAGAFAITGDTCSGQVVNVGNDCDLTLMFAPATPGLKLARVEVETNDPESPAVVPLAGIAVVADALFADSFE